MATERPLCEVIGCDETATETRQFETVLNGRMQAGTFVVTKRGTSAHQFCETHAAEADRTKLADYVGQRCCY